MKKSLALTMTASGQIGGGEEGPSLQEETSAYLIAAGLPTNDAYATALDNYVIAIKAAGAFTTDERHFILCGPNELSSKIDLINPNGSTITASGTTTHTPYLGAKGNGTTGEYSIPGDMDSFTKFTSTSCHLGIAFPEAVTAGTTGEAGSVGGYVSVLTRISDAACMNITLFGSPNNLDVETADPPLNAGTLGYYVRGFHNVGPGDAYSGAMYQDGVAFDAADTGGSLGSESEPIVLFTPGFGLHSDRNVALFHIGSELTAQQVADRNTAWQAFLTAISGL